MKTGPKFALARYILSGFLAAMTALTPALASAATPTGPGKPVASAVPAVPAAKTAESGKLFVAVMDLDPVGATKVEASAISDRFREELLKTGKFTLVDRSQMDAVLGEQALQQTGCTSQECAVQVGKVLGVRDLIAGKVTKISDTQWQVNVTMTDVETSEALRAESLRYKGDYFSMLDQAMGQLATKLAAPAGARPDLGEYVASQQQAAQEQQQTKSSSSKWWWIAGGVVVLAAAAAGGSKGGGGGGKGSGSSCSTCGNVGVGW